MGRKFISIPIKELINLFEEEILDGKHIASCHAYPKGMNKLKRDLKIEFDLENFLCHQGKHHKRDLLGPYILDEVFPFIGCYAGGDWEMPVFFIVYWDGKNLRAYIPTKGNVFVAKEKRAATDEDPEFSQKFDKEEVLNDIRKRFDLLPKEEPVVEPTIKGLLISLGYIEEQSLAVLPVNYQSKFETPGEALESFKDALLTVFKDEIVPKPRCKHCHRGGSKGKRLSDLFRDIYYGTCDSIGIIYDEFQKLGWDLNGNFFPGKYVMIANFDAYLDAIQDENDPKSHEGEIFQIIDIAC